MIWLTFNWVVGYTITEIKKFWPDVLNNMAMFISIFVSLKLIWSIVINFINISDNAHINNSIKYIKNENKNKNKELLDDAVHTSDAWM